MLDKNTPPKESEINAFLRLIDFTLPVGFIDFFNETDGADISTDNHNVVLWPLTEMIKLNKEYKVEEYAPDFFIIGSDGGNTAYAVERCTGFIFELPFIVMSNEEAVFRNKTFTEFVASL